MSVPYRYLVRSKLTEALVNEFNTVNAALAGADPYNVPPLDIVFTYPSPNFIQAQVDALSFKTTMAAITPPGLALYTSQAVDERIQTNTKFSGRVLAHLDFFLKYSALRDTQTPANDITEKQATFEPEIFGDCVEDSVATVLKGTTAMRLFADSHCPLVEYGAERDLVELEGDGFLQRVAITLRFQVHV